MLRLFSHEPILKRNYRAFWNGWCKINPTQTMVFVGKHYIPETSMPSRIRKMKLNEAFDSINEAGEIRLLEIAQMLAERYPKMVSLPEDGSANDESALAGQAWAQSMVRPSLLM